MDVLKCISIIRWIFILINSIRFFWFRSVFSFFNSVCIFVDKMLSFAFQAYSLFQCFPYKGLVCNVLTIASFHFSFLCCFSHFAWFCLSYGRGRNGQIVKCFFELELKLKFIFHLLQIEDQQRGVDAIKDYKPTRTNKSQQEPTKTNKD